MVLSANNLCTRVNSILLSGFHLCLIFRGLPGRGKTYLAKIVENHCKSNGFSTLSSAADDYMVSPITGLYEYDESKLFKAHSLCTTSLINAMEKGIPLVIQHNTNIADWESQLIRSNAEDLNYIVGIVEPEYAWSLDEELPEPMRSIFVNTHGVSSTMLSKMKSRKQNILPRYLAHWILSEKLVSNIKNSMEDELFAELIQHFDVFKPSSISESISESVSESTSESVSDSLSKLSIAKPTKSSKPMLNKILHVTTDYFNPSDAKYMNYETFHNEMLESDHINMYAIYQDNRGTGILASPIYSDVTNNVPNHYGQYIKGDIDTRLPHITITVSEGSRAKEIGTAALEFKQELDNYRKINSISTLIGYHVVGKFRSFLFPNPIAVPSVYGGSYGVYPNTFTYIRWKFANSIESDVFRQLSTRKDVSMITVPISESILPSINGKPWTLADLRINPSKGRSDDELYTENDFLRRFLPRGLTYLVSPTGEAMKVVVGLSKFTGTEDDTVVTIDPLDTIYENGDSITSNSSNNSDSVQIFEKTIQSSPTLESITTSHSMIDTMTIDIDKSMEVTKFFTRPMSTALNPWILAMEKANGEAAHVSAISIDGTVYFISGSKNVHILTRVTNREDIDSYDGQRYAYANEIAHCLYDKMDSINPMQRQEFIDLLINRKLTAIFEYEDPSHPHIIPILQKRLKFITFTRNGIDQDYNSEMMSSNLPSYSKSSVDIPSSLRSSVSAMPPMEALHIASNVGLDRVWCFNYPYEQIAQLESLILVESNMRIEGCVLYYMDNNEVLGLVKCKNAYYICSRAIRERITQFTTNLAKELESVTKLSHLSNISKSKDGKERRNSKSDSLSHGRDHSPTKEGMHRKSIHDDGDDNSNNSHTNTATMNMIIDKSDSKLINYLRSTQSDFNQRIKTKGFEAKKLIEKRFNEVAVDQVPMTVDCKNRWIEISHLLVDSISSNLSTSMSHIIDRIIHSLPSSSSSSPDSSMDHSSHRKMESYQLTEFITKTMREEIGILITNISPNQIRNTWPTLFDSFVENHGGLNIQLNFSKYSRNESNSKGSNLLELIQSSPRSL